MPDPVVSPFTLQDIYNSLNPTGVSSATAGATVTPSLTGRSNIIDEMMTCLLDPKGIFRDWETIYKNYKSYFEKSDTNDDATKFYIHGISTKKIGDSHTLPNEEDGSDNYWKLPSLPSGDIKVDTFFTNIRPSEDTGAEVTIISTKHPYINPARRGTRNVGLFLNYMPNLVASQLVPYLDVQLEITRTGGMGNFASTPSQLRFLLGSVSKDGLSPNDQLLDTSFQFRKDVAKIEGGPPPPPSATVNGDTLYGNDRDALGTTGAKHWKSAEARDKYYAEHTAIFKTNAYTGMEMFLMPQSLTNMETLGPSSTHSQDARAIRAKPFLPFASIEAFDVNVVNAGAGAMAHRKASLRLKVHDKARLAEISEFIRGPAGFREVIVHTTYGWIAPRARYLEDEYVKFINDNMMIRDAWSIINSSFQFNESGQATVTLEMVSNSRKAFSEVTMEMLSEANASLGRLQKVVSGIREYIFKASEGGKFNVSAAQMSVLNALSTGDYSDLKGLGVDETMKSIVSAMKRGEFLDATDLKKFEGLVGDLTRSSEVKGIVKKGGQYMVGNVNAQLEMSIETFFKQLAAKPDPFLADDKRKDYFNEALAKSIKNYQSKSRMKALDELYKKPDVTAKLIGKGASPMQIATEVMSFGKIFASTVAPSFANLDNCDEVQVIFYTLNEECGPVSSHSIAEFPIDVRKLSYDYLALCKEKSTTYLHVEDFMKIVISQFSDQLSPAYGRYDSFEVRDPTKGEAELKKEKPKKGEANTTKAESELLQWSVTYGDLRLPVIEYSIETGYNTASNANFAQNLERGVLEMLIAERDANGVGKPTGSKLIKRIHIYDKQYNPYANAQKIFKGRDPSVFQVGEISESKVSAAIATKLQSNTPELTKQALDEYERLKEAAAKGGAADEAALQRFVTTSALGANANPASFTNTPNGGVSVPADRESVKSYLMSFVPTIMPGTNGSLVHACSVSSKTDGTQGAANLAQAMKGQEIGKASVSDSGIHDVNNMPMRVSPVQLTMTTKGTPIAQIYQQYFVDMNTGTSLDNLYMCTQLQHSIAKGKFSTNWTFMLQSGYAKFTSPPTLFTVTEHEFVRQLREKAADDEAAKKSSKKRKST